MVIVGEVSAGQLLDALKIEPVVFPGGLEVDYETERGRERMFFESAVSPILFWSLNSGSF